MQHVLVSSCLLGLPARYNGEQVACEHPVLRRWQDEGRIVAFCPEVAGGLPTPRPPAEVAEGKGGRLVLAGEAKVIDKTGADVTEPFLSGGRLAQDLVRTRQILIAILKEGSPSCGSSYSYDGSFKSVRLPLPGVTTAALEEAGVRVFSENQLDEAAAFLDSLEQVPEIETVGSTVIYQNRWLTLREDAIVRADGSRGLYSVVEKSDFAVIAAVSDGELHLVEQYRYPVQGRYWELPQGSWEGESIDPLDLARAELREETGLTAASMQHVGRLYLAYGYSTQAYDVFLATDLSAGETALDAEEIGLISRPFKLEQVEAMILDGTIRDATTVAVLGLLRLKGLLQTAQ